VTRTGEEINFDPDQLLLSRRLNEIRTDPFCFFKIDDYLPEDLYGDLRESFPDGSTYSSDDSGKLGFRSSVESNDFDEFCEQHPAWKRLLAFFRSDAFVLDAGRLLAPAVVNARGWRGRRPWLNCSNVENPSSRLRYMFEEPVRTTFQISQLPNGAEVVPHTDAPRKLVSLLLYFRDDDWRDEFGGGTEFYEPIDPERARTWKPTDRIPFSELKSIGEVGFARNCLAGFVRSPNSYHGVRPIVCPEGFSRRVLLINIKRVTWVKREIG